MESTASIDDAPFDPDALKDLLLDEENGDQYRRVLEGAIEAQREYIEKGRYEEYDHVGIRAADAGAQGWEFNQFVRIGIMEKSYSSNSGSQFRLGTQQDDEEWIHWHDAIQTVLDIMEDERSTIEGADGAAAGGTSASLDDVDVDELFTDVVGYEDRLEMIRRTLDKKKRIHHLLVGPPGSGKSMILDDLVDNVPGAHRTVMAGNQSSAQGIVDVVKRQRPTVLVVEEIEKGSKADREALMTLCGQGYVQETKADGRTGDRIEVDTIVVAAGNDRDSITPESLVDRFTVHPIEEYSTEEFVEVCESVVPDEVDADMQFASYIARRAAEDYGSTSVRDVIDLADLSENRDEADRFMEITLSQ